MGSLVCDWLALTDVHAQRAEQQHGAISEDLSAAHFLRVRRMQGQHNFGHVRSARHTASHVAMRAL